MGMPLPPGKRIAIPPLHPDVDPVTRTLVEHWMQIGRVVEAISLAEEAEDDRQRGRHLHRHLGNDYLRAMSGPPSTTSRLHRCGRNRPAIAA